MRFDRATFLAGCHKDLYDPITRLKPHAETEISALIALKHNCGSIDWHKVQLVNLKDKECGTTAASIFERGLMYCEYPLFTGGDQAQINLWGGLRPDLVYISSDEQTIALIEVKINSGMTGGQPRGYLEFLRANKRGRRMCLMIAAPGALLDEGWYATELKNVRPNEDEAYLVRLENVFDAVVQR